MGQDKTITSQDVVTPLEEMNKSGLPPHWWSINKAAEDGRTPQQKEDSVGGAVPNGESTGN